MVLAGDFLFGASDDLRSVILRKDYDAVDVAEYDVTGSDSDAAAFDRRVTFDHARTPSAVQRSDATVDHGEPQLLDVPQVTDQAVGHAAHAAARERGCGQELPPGRDSLAPAVAGQHGNIARLQVVKKFDLDLVGILAVANRVGIDE